MTAAHDKNKFPRAPLFAALARACDEIDFQLSSDKSADTSTGEFTTKFQALEGENKLLRQQIRELRRQHVDVISDITEPVNKPRKCLSATLEALPSEDDCRSLIALKAAHTRLRRQFDALSNNFKSATAVLRRRKEERNEWRRKAQNLRAEVESLRAQSFFPSAGETHVGAEALSMVTSRDKQPTAGDAASDNGFGYLKVLLESPKNKADAKQPALPALANHYTDSSLPIIKQELSSDAPIVVSERPVRKRPRIDKPSHAILKDSSATESHTKLRISNTQESLDLGDIEQSMTTPRKPKNLENVFSESKVQASKKETIGFASNAEPGKKPRLSIHLPHQQDVLRQMSPNFTSTRSATLSGTNCRRVRQLAQGISKLAEDRGSYASNASLLGEGPSEFFTSNLEGNRVSQLLDMVSGRTSEDPSSIGTDPSPSYERRDSVAVSKPFISAPQEGHPSRGRHCIKEEKQAASSRNNSPARPSAPSARSKCKAKDSDGRSLRERRLSTLGMDDFRVNPTVNRGQSFAFSDVVRDKSERARMQGCTKMHCCGKVFRELALSQRPNPPLTPAQRMEEQQLLEQYLGDRAYRLANMDKEERQQLWVEAKTQELANKYGKHRSHYSRMQSPPGFWNADFPSSQQLDAERAEATAREKGSVSERYREAMRPNGRWVFKDE